MKQTNPVDSFTQKEAKYMASIYREILRDTEKRTR